MTKLSINPNIKTQKYEILFNDFVIADFITLESAERFCWSKPCRDIIKFHLDKINENK